VLPTLALGSLAGFKNSEILCRKDRMLEDTQGTGVWPYLGIAEAWLSSEIGQACVRLGSPGFTCFRLSRKQGLGISSKQQGEAGAIAAESGYKCSL